ncbi:MAG: hypothetical protein ACP5C4_05845 [Methanomicrobiales archaeon]
MTRMTAAGLVLVLALCVVCAPAAAFSADRLTVDIGTGGDAEISFAYSLSWLEQIGVYFRIADPAGELQRSLEDLSGKPVTVTEVSSGRAVFEVQEFAHTRAVPDGVQYRTPAIDFTDAEAELKKQWFAPLIRPDFSPQETVVRFPDGYTERITDALSLPRLTHVVSG